MKKILIIFTILTVSIAFFSFNKAFAEEKLAISAEEAAILFLEGSVKVKSLKTNRWANAVANMVLSRGDKLKTGTNSWAEIGFGKDFVNIVRVKENTLVELIDLGPIKIGLLKGEVRSLVESLSRDTTFEVRTPTAVCGARGTGWDTNTDGKKVIVDAYEDEVYFYSLSKEGADPIIKAGKRGILDDPLKPILIKDLPFERMKDWSKWKDDFSKRMGVEKRGIKGKVDKIDKTQSKVEDVLGKGKLDRIEKKNKDKIEKRTETKEESDSGHSS